MTNAAAREQRDPVLADRLEGTLPLRQAERP
jgi:hypothetical protein